MLIRPDRLSFEQLNDYDIDYESIKNHAAAGRKNLSQGRRRCIFLT
jgi:hypothetical protein